MLFVLSKSVLTVLQRLLLVIVLTGSHAFAADLTSSRAYFQDDTRQLSFEQVQAKHFTPFKEVLSRGYTKAAVWVKVDITPPANAQPDDPLMVLIKPVFLDEIQLFDPLDTRGVARVAGDATAFSDKEYNSLLHTFVIPAGQAPRSIWLRVVTTSALLVDVQTFTHADMLEQEFEHQIFAFGVLAVIGMFFLHVLINWINYRETLYALFVVRQFYFFGFTATLFGLQRYLLHDYFSPLQLDAMFSWLVIGATFITFVFERQMLKEYKPNKFGQWGMTALLLSVLIVFVMMALGFTLEALMLNMVFNIIGMILFLSVSVFCIDSQANQQADHSKLFDKRLITGYYVIIIVTMLLSSLLSFLGLMAGNRYTSNVLVYYTLISGGLMTVLMQFRSNKLVKAQNDYEKNLSLSQQQTELEKKRRQEQAHLLHMLMHELKNPLAVIEMAQHADNDKVTTTKYISRSIQNMREVIDRCVKTDKLAEGNVDVRIEAIDLNSFIHACLLDREHDDNETGLLLGKDLFVQTDKQFLQIMLNNLLDNAQRYGDPRVPIELSAYSSPNAQGHPGVTIAVSNRPGAAFWPDTDRVFTKYYRSKGAEGKSGTGLGLYLVRTMATLVGGDCRYVPDDKHIRFELWLPS